jgi:hypothetical protein
MSRPLHGGGRVAAPVAAALLLATAALAAHSEPLPPGTYRLELRMAALTTMPLLGSARTATVSLARATISREGDGLRQTHRVCAVRFEGGVPIVRMTMPPRLIAALAAPEYPVAVEYDAAAWRYRADLGVSHVGYEPDGADDALPTTGDDRRLRDIDGDGRPGATLALSIAGLADGSLWVVQRGHSLLDGRVIGVGQAEGRIDVRAFDQALLGADPSFLARSPEIAADPERSTFSLVRVADGTTCADLATAAYDPGPETAPAAHAAARAAHVP